MKLLARRRCKRRGEKEREESSASVFPLTPSWALSSGSLAGRFIMWGSLKPPCQRQRGVESVRANPLDVFGEDIVLSILGGLDARSLARCTSVSKEWGQLAREDSLWRMHCEELWAGKESVLALAANPAVPRLEAFRLSAADGMRGEVTSEDLCGSNWVCRFKPMSPVLEPLDSVWGSHPPMRRFFSPDGFLCAAAGDPLYGGRRFPWRLLPARGRRIRLGRRGSHPSSSSSPSPSASPSPLLLQVGTFPPLVPERRPDWGWQMHNEWVLYTSIGKRGPGDEGAVSEVRPPGGRPDNDGFAAGNFLMGWMVLPGLGGEPAE